jgi:hypothetical protein
MTCFHFRSGDPQKSAGSTDQTVLNTGTLTSVPANTQQTIVTYTAGAGDSGITRIVCSGTDYAKFELYKNVSLVETQRSGPDRNAFFGPIKLQAGDIIDVKVEHFVTGSTANFEATIYGV